MLAKPDGEVLQALNRIARSGNWEKVEAWLRDSREACVKRSLDSVDVTARQAQGGFVVLDELMTLVQKAADGPQS